MSFKENLKAKIHLDRLLRQVVQTMREPPQIRWLDKDLIRELLKGTDFKYRKSRNLDLYVRSPADGEMEVLVLDNELPIYRTDVGDVTLRKNPHWKDVFSLRNIRRIMNDQDVVVSRGKDSLERVYSDALGRLDFTYTRDDLEPLVEDGRRGVELGSAEPVRESLDLFFEVLGFEPVFFAVTQPEVYFFGRPMPGRGEAPHFEHLVVFNQDGPTVGLKKGAFSPRDEADLEWVDRYVEGRAKADFEGVEVFEFLAELALAQEQKPLVHL